MTVELLFPVAQMVGGNLAKMFQSKDDINQPKFDKNGDPCMRCNFGVAIPKIVGQDWKQTEWGIKIFNEAQAAFPNGEFNAPTFAWKITDGDSMVPNKSGNKPCDQTGYPGNWIVWFSQSWLPKKVNADASSELTEPDSIVPGYFVQVVGTCLGNNNKGTPKSPGVYQNPKAVVLVAYGERIAGNEDVDLTGYTFGNQPLPPGASATPIGMTN
ncbi:unnamed protein product, partial [marine sediment metagenome]